MLGDSDVISECHIPAVVEGRATAVPTRAVSIRFLSAEAEAEDFQG